LRLDPAGKVPVLVDGDMVIPESAAIVLYLADKYREKKLLPASVGERAQVYRWIMFAVTELEQPLWRISKHTALYPEDKRLPACGERPRRRRAAEQRDELAAFHSITSSARASKAGGTARPSASCGWKIDHELELGRKLHRQIAGLRPSKSWPRSRLNGESSGKR
jgi:Glutathione S-transferase, N-terminal domain